ncbi:hypothetical protein [Deinococcus sp. ME38]|uniref:hypothetical protein n=1 Tax=Deinococcus sp. ME38 TaxID=3400344 RepID=UPI003B5C137B
MSEIIVTNINSIGSREMAVTDLDVLAIRPSKSLKWEVIIGDCKTQKLSAVNRAFWVKGVMDSYKSEDGFLIVKTDRKSGKKIDIDHRLLANKMGIKIIDEVDFEDFDKSIHYPYGSSNNNYDLVYLDEIRQFLKSSSALNEINEYLFRDFWTESDRIVGIRKILNLIRKHRGELDPAKPTHRDTVTLACSIFSISLAECVGAIFNQYIHPDSREELSSALKPLLWSGWSQYNSLNQLKKALSKPSNSTEDDTKDNDLVLPLWTDFTNLIRGLLDDPRSSFEIPRLFQSLIFDLGNKSEPFLEYSQKEHLSLLKQSMLVYMYFCRSSRLPREFESEIINSLAKKQAIIAEIGLKTSNPPTMPKLITDEEMPF